MARNFEASSNDHLDAGNPSALNLTGDEVTVSIWVRLESTSTEGKILAKWSDADGAFQYLLSTDGGDKCQFAIFNGGTKIAVGTSTLVVGTWFHIAGTYDGSDVRVYCNGTEEDSTAATGNMSSKNTPVRIGAGSGGSGTENPFDGDIGHAAIWERALTAGEIKSLASGINPLQITRENLISYWPLNGQSPEADIVGGFDMTLNGTTAVEEPPISNSIVAPIVALCALLALALSFLTYDSVIKDGFVLINYIWNDAPK